jgi:hypothetical protein
MKPRIPLPPDALNESGLPDAAWMAPAISEARGRLRKAGFRMHKVDAVTTELVRMRNARYQNCFL